MDETKPVGGTSEANKRQVGGSHYKTGGEEHWDRVVRLKLDYFQAQITKYTERAPHKNRKQDIEKAMHFCQKYLEVFDVMYPPKKDAEQILYPNKAYPSSIPPEEDTPSLR